MTSKPTRPRTGSHAAGGQADDSQAEGQDDSQGEGQDDSQGEGQGDSQGEGQGQGQQVRDSDVTWSTFGYLGAIFLGPVIPLVIYVVRRRRSPFMRYHAATALNLTLTWMLYGLCCLILGGLLVLDSLTVALVVALPLAFVLWLAMLNQLIRGIGAASRGERHEVPGWICAQIAK